MHRVTLSVLLTLGALGRIQAECVTAGSICQEFDRSEIVFLGSVTKLDWDPLIDRNGPLRPQAATFHVLQGFKGVSTADLTLGLASGGEQRLFSAGERVLIYAQRSTSVAGRWSTACSRTRDASETDPEVLALRNLGARAEGTVVESSAWPETIPDPHTPPDLSGLRVTAKSPATTVVTSIRSNSGGQFTLWLVPGRYTVTVSGPGYAASSTEVVVTGSTRCVTASAFVLRRVSHTEKH